MQVWVDTANLDEIREWRQHPWVSGFTTNPTLMKGQVGYRGPKAAEHRYGGINWAELVVEAANGYPISIDGPPEVWDLGLNVIRKIINPSLATSIPPQNFTAVCHPGQINGWWSSNRQDVISVFAGRILDTGRDPQPVIDAAKQTGAQVLWASVREPYHMVMAEQAGCDIITVPPAILQKWLDWHGKPLEQVAAETIAQFDKDREGLW